MITTLDQAPVAEVRTSGVEDRELERFRPAPLMVAAVIGAAAATSIVAIPTTAAVARPNATTSTSSTSGLVAAPSRGVSSEALVRGVRESANLTWDQLARIFGVSRRSVHNWAAGDKISAHNLELVGRLGALIASLPGSPDERRVALFAPDANGESPIDAFRRAVARSGHNVNGPYAGPGALLGA